LSDESANAIVDHFADVETHGIDEEELRRSRAMEARDSEGDVRDVDDHRGALVAHPEGVEAIPVALFEALRPVVGRFAQGRHVRAAVEGGAQRHVRGREQALDDRQRLRTRCRGELAPARFELSLRFRIRSGRHCRHCRLFR